MTANASSEREAKRIFTVILSGGAGGAEVGMGICVAYQWR